MANIAFIANGIVVCIAPTLADAPEGLVYDQTQDATGANVGDTWTGSGYQRPPGEPVRTVTRADFQRRFTPAEYFAAKTLAATDSNMAYIFDLFQHTTEIRLDHPDTLQGVGYMQQQGILTAERVAAILA